METELVNKLTLGFHFYKEYSARKLIYVFSISALENGEERCWYYDLGEESFRSCSSNNDEFFIRCTKIVDPDAIKTYEISLADKIIDIENRQRLLLNLLEQALPRA